MNLGSFLSLIFLTVLIYYSKENVTGYKFILGLIVEVNEVLQKVHYLLIQDQKQLQ